EFLKRFNEVILKPRKLDYKVMFPGPTGTNAVESALKLARKVTGRKRIMSFTNGFHGMTLGSLAITGNLSKRAGGQVELDNAVTMPFDQFISTNVSLNLVEQYVRSGGRGVELPAAIILEKVRGEVGFNAEGTEWLEGMETMAKKQDIW